jgi:hypothetical protein
MRKPVNSLQYLYHKAQTEQDPKLLSIYTIVNAHFKFDRTKNLEKILELTNKIAIHSGKITDHFKKKHREKQYHVNGKVYYIFDRLSAWNVGIVTEPEIYIYE